MKVIKILLLLILLISLVIVGFFLNAYFAKDIPAFSDPRLALPEVTVLENDNAYYDLIKISENLAEKDLVYLDQAAAKNNFYDPVASKIVITTDLQTLEASQVYRVRAAAKLKLGKVDELITQGKSQEALIETEKVIKIGYVISNSQSPLIDYLIGRAVSKMGWDEANKINLATLDPSFKQTHAQILEKYVDTRAGLINAIKFEYAYTSSTLDYIKTNTAEYDKMLSNPGSHYLLPNRTKKILADNYLSWFDQLNQKCPFEFTSSRYSPPKSRYLISPNASGLVLADMVLVALQPTAKRMCDTEQAAQTVIGKLK